jgi:porphobilinogen deaminase
VIVALTKGVDPSDSLVLREKETLFSLPPFARIATSSKRREAAVKELRPDFCFVDIRGSIDARLSHLDRGDIDGVVIAEAALIRLGWTHRNRLRLEVETAPLQGKLAILIREGDDEMKHLFAPLHGCAT